MSALAIEVIKTRLAADVPAADLDLVAGLIGDRVGPVQSMATIDAAIAAARVEFGPLFSPSPAAGTAPTPTGFRPPRTADQKAADRLQAALAAGNPWTNGSVTNQVLVEHLAPDRAAALRLAAGR